MKSYLEFGERMIDFITKDMIEKNLTTIPETWNETVISNYKLSHLFEVDPTTQKLLVLTKTPECKASDKMPFYRMFIDINFSCDDLRKLGVDVDWGINGVLVVDQFIFKDDRYKIEQLEPHDADAEMIMFYMMLYKGDKIKFDVFVVPVTQMDWVKPFKARRNEHRFILDFFRNMLHLMNDPQIKTVKIDRDEERNLKRDKKGKLPIPERTIIKITGVLKDYINKLESDSELWHYGYSFWVRGHFKHWRSDRYKRMLGLRTWIPPFIKGRGILVKKDYNVEMET